MGMSRVSAGDRQTWAQYAGDEDSLHVAAIAVRAGDVVSAPEDPDGQVLRRNLERNLTPSFTSSGRATETKAERREAALVDKFAMWLIGQGVKVSSHHYRVTAPPLRTDLFDESNQVIWEAKGEVGRFAVRLAIGQLLDYRRLEPGGVRIGVLLPRRPSDDLLDLIASIPALISWPMGEDGGFVVCGDARSHAGGLAIESESQGGITL